MKKTSIILLILTFLAFLFYQTQKSVDFQVLRINSPTEIVLDLNQNGVEDDDEIIEFETIQSFSTKPTSAQNALAQKLKISSEDAMGLGFLAENFAKENLDGKKVKLENSSYKNQSFLAQNLFQNCKAAQICGPTRPIDGGDGSSELRGGSQIIVDDKNYENMLVNKGLAIKKDSQPSAQFKQNLAKVRKLHLVIFNNKSHKYHKLNCKYGLIAHNSQIIPAVQLPTDAKPCKFCHSHNQKAKGKKPKDFSKYRYEDEIPDIKSPATEFQANNLRIFLTDFTRVLKPSNACNTNVCEALVQEINSAQNTIDFAIYGYTKVPQLQCALENAQKRGVRVRFVYDLDGKNENIYPDTAYLAKIFTNNQHDISPNIMHDKFFVFDGKTVLTGSANISNTDMSGFNSNAVVLIDSPKVAEIYSQEFEQMYSGKFHKQKKKIQVKEDENLAVYFSPEDRAITTQVIPLINCAQKYIYIPAFLITHKGLSDSLIQASKRGVAVKIILDATNTHTPSSKMKALRENGVQVKTENLAGKLHSKSIIIDDLYTVIGSMNFSRSGESLNDENLIIIKNREVAIFYKTFFQYLWKRIPDKWLKFNARSESPDSIGSCSDGIDNDFDGKIDKADDSCKPILKK